MAHDDKGTLELNIPSSKNIADKEAIGASEPFEGANGIIKFLERRNAEAAEVKRQADRNPIARNLSEAYSEVTQMPLDFMYGTVPFLDQFIYNPIMKGFAGKDQHLPGAPKLDEIWQQTEKTNREKWGVGIYPQDSVGSLVRGAMNAAIPAPLRTTPAKGVMQKSAALLEPFIPGRQGKGLGSYLWAGGPTAAMSEVGRRMNSGETITEILDDFNPFSEAQAGSNELAPPEVRKFDPPKITVPIGDGQVAPVTPPDKSVGNRQHSVPSVPNYMPDEEGLQSGLHFDETWKAILLGGVGLALGTAAYRQFKNIRKRKELDSFMQTVGKSIKDLDTTITDLPTWMATQFSHQDAPIYNILYKAGWTQEAVESVKDLIRTSVLPDAVMSRGLYASLHGKLPRTHIRLPRLDIHLELVAKLPANKGALYADALAYGTRLDDMIKNPNGPQFWKKTDGTTISRRDMQQVYDMGKADPDVGPLMEEVYTFYQGLLEYAQRNGAMTRKHYQKLRHENPRYVPMQYSKFEDDSAFSELMSIEPFERLDELAAKRGGKALNFMRKRLGLEEGAVMSGEMKHPAQLMEGYLHNTVRFVELNHVRSTLLRQMADNAVVGKDGEVVVKRLPAKSKSHKTITVMENGRRVQYSISDDYLRRAIEFRPYQTNKAFAWPRRLKQEMTTGVYAFWFPQIASMYDVWSVISTMPPKQRGAVLDEILKLGSDAAGLKNGPRLGAFDPSIVLAPLTATTRHVGAQAFINLSRYINVGLRSTEGLIPVLKKMPNAEATLQHWANVMAKAHANAAAGIRMQYGGGNAPYLSKPGFGENDIHSMVNDFAPSFARQMRAEKATAGGAISDTFHHYRTSVGIRAYLSFVNALHNAARDAHLDAGKHDAKTVNRFGQMVFDEEKLQRLAGESRWRAGDANARAGDAGTYTGSVSQFMSDSDEYYQIFNQVMASYSAALVRHPLHAIQVHTAWIGAGLAMLAGQFEYNDEARRTYFNRMSASDREKIFPILWNTDGELLIWYALSPEQSLTWSPIVEGWASMFNYHTTPTPESRQAQSIGARILAGDIAPPDMDRVSHAASSAFKSRVAPDMMPTTGKFAIQAGAAAIGGSVDIPPIPFGDVSDRGIAQYPYRSLEAEADPDLTKSVEGMIDALMGQIGRFAIINSHVAKREMKQSGDFLVALEQVWDRTVEELSKTSRNPLGGLYTNAVLTKGADPYEDTDVRNSINAVAELSKHFGDIRNPYGKGVSAKQGTHLPSNYKNMTGTEFAQIVEPTMLLSKDLAQWYTPFYRRVSSAIFEINRANHMGMRERSEAITRLRYIAQELNKQARTAIEKVEHDLSLKLGRTFMYQDANVETLQGTKFKNSPVLLRTPPK